MQSHAHANHVAIPRRVPLPGVPADLSMSLAITEGGSMKVKLELLFLRSCVAIASAIGWAFYLWMMYGAKAVPHD